MDVILHFSAFGTASSDLRSYTRYNHASLEARGVSFWETSKAWIERLHAETLNLTATRIGKAKVDLVRPQIEQLCNNALELGIQNLVVSDENLLGNPRTNLKAGELFPDAGVRTCMAASAFGEKVCRVAISIAPLDEFWAGSLLHEVSSGGVVPTPEELETILRSPRSWRDVIEDVARLLPQAEILILRDEQFCGMPRRLLAHILTNETELPEDGVIPFPSSENSRQFGPPDSKGPTPHILDPDILSQTMCLAGNAFLRELYQDDLFWLRAGGRNVATLIEEEETPRPRRGELFPISWTVSGSI